VLYLVHHGDAVGPEVDAVRPLSARGRLEVDRLALEAAQRGAKPAVIWHSGKLRAKQTAEAFWRHCNPLATFSAIRGLQPADPVQWILDAIAGESRDVMLVGHFPHLPQLLGLLLAGDPVPARATFPLHGVVALELRDGKWSETWRLT
jgi:phosphohistidine phosphatase